MSEIVSQHGSAGLGAPPAPGTASPVALFRHAASLADICLYAYTHSAGVRGGFDMTRFPAVRGWLARVAALPGHVTIDG